MCRVLFKHFLEPRQGHLLEHGTVETGLVTPFPVHLHSKEVQVELSLKMRGVDFSTLSSCSVIFDPGPGVELIVEEAFKALSFTITSNNSKYTQVLTYSAQGALISSFKYKEVEFSETLKQLNPGFYLITFLNSVTSNQTRWIKR